MKGGIRDDKLRESCTRALGLEEFDGQAFLDRVAFISLPESYKAEIHIKDGTVMMDDCTPMDYQNCWTEEYLARASEYRRSHSVLGKKGSCCFTTMIKCSGCGDNYQAESSGGKRYWRCRTNRDGIPLREDALQAMATEVLGLDAFDDSTVMERLDTILVDGNTLAFRFKDGHEEHHLWVRPKRPGHKHSEEEKEHMRQIMKERWIPEKKKAMSESIKNFGRSEETNGKKCDEDSAMVSRSRRPDCKQSESEGGGLCPRIDGSR